MKRRWAGRWVCVAGLLMLAVACTNEASPERLCLPGETRACSGAGQCPGAEVCQPDGQTFGACDCGTPPTPDVAAPDAGAGRAPSNQLGSRCVADGDCGSALSCWSATARSFLGQPGGAAGGYCTAPCTDATDCAAFDPASGCGGGLCLLGCFSKDPAPGEGKCLGRPDLACWSGAALGLEPFDATVRQGGICLPACGSDEDCPGRACDLALGSCVDTPTAGAPIGAACARAEDCAGGLCQLSASGQPFCTATCSVGALGCGYGVNAQPRDAMCLGAAVFDELGSEGRGDVGLCLELCDQASDCAQPGWRCIEAPDLRGRAGFCVEPAEAAALAADAGIDGGTP